MSSQDHIPVYKHTTFLVGSLNENGMTVCLLSLPEGKVFHYSVSVIRPNITATLVVLVRRVLQMMTAWYTWF